MTDDTVPLPDTPLKRGGEVSMNEFVEGCWAG